MYFSRPALKIAYVGVSCGLPCPCGSADGPISAVSSSKTLPALFGFVCFVLASANMWRSGYADVSPLIVYERRKSPHLHFRCSCAQVLHVPQAAELHFTLEQTVSLRERTQKHNRRQETGGRCIPAAAGGRLAFKYPCHYTCISNSLAINHIEMSLFTYQAFMQPSDVFRTNSSDGGPPLKSPKTEVCKSYSWLWCQIFESCWLVSCYIWLKAFGGRTGQH